ncbi:reverse transcriptase domain-containing protein, partial [Tanacetum coccineum]
MRETHVDLQSQGNYTLFRETMALPAQNINHSAFRSMFDNEKLSGTNFNDWFARLKLVLRVEKKMHIIEQPLPPPPAPISEPNVVAEWTKQYDAHTEIACLMLGSMTPELHRQFELYYPYDMIQELRSMFEKQAGVEKFDLIQSFHACKQEEGKPVADYVLKMKGYVEKLERLGYVLPQDITVGLILNGLTKDFAGFVSNYKMHNMGKTIGEIHAMLMEYEKSLPKKAETPQVMMIKKGKIQKANKKSLKVKGKVIGKGKDKKVYVPKPTNPKPIAKERPAKDDACHHCKEVGHWKRNCPVYLAELLKKKKQVGDASSSGIFMIELFSLPNCNSWVYDTGCGTHICNTKQGFRIEKKLKRGALYLYVGNGVREQVEAIGSYDLVLPNGLVICLDNCHYAPSIMRGVVSVSRLVDNGFVQKFTDYGISISKNNVLYFNGAQTYLTLHYFGTAGLAQIRQDDKEIVWGCEALVKRDTPDKLKQRSVKCILIAILKVSNNVMDISGRAVDLEEIHRKKKIHTPSVITSKHFFSFKRWRVLQHHKRKITKDMFLVYGGNPSIELRVECYCDAGFEMIGDDSMLSEQDTFRFERKRIYLDYFIYENRIVNKDLTLSLSNLTRLKEYYHPKRCCLSRIPPIPTTSSSPPKVVDPIKTEVIKGHGTTYVINGRPKDVQPPVVQDQPQVPNSEPVVAPVSAPMPNLKSSIPYPSRRNDERRREKANDQIEKFYEIFKDLSFEISLTDALILMPKFASTLKALIGNKEKLSEMARTPLNEHCSAVILNKLPEKLGDPGKFLIPCDFPRMDECLALADLGASINLMLLFVWKKLSLPELTPTFMTLKLADRSISQPIGIAEDVYIKVGKFQFLTDFVVVDFDADPRVPRILGRSFLKIRRALIDVYEGELTLRVGKEAEYSQEVLGFSNVIASGNPTPYYDPIVSTSSPTLTPFGDSDFLLEEVNAFLTLEDDPTSPEVDHFYYGSEGDILLLEAFLNDDPLLPPPTQGNYFPEIQKELKV